MKPGPKLRRYLIFLVVLMGALVVLCELIVSSYFYWTKQALTCIFFEDPGIPVLHFDAVTGYRFAERPFRMASLRGQKLEYLGRPTPNKLGFIDHQTPLPNRSDSETFRIAVFGDSFTDGWFFDTTWPDRVEELAQATGVKLELINLAQGRTGLGNWMAIVDNLLIKEDYQLDGLLFAVWHDDLVRRRTYMHLDSDGTLIGGRSPNWRPDSGPRTLAEAASLLKRTPARAISPAAFERLLTTGRGPFCLTLLDGARLFWSTKKAPQTVPEVELASPERQAAINHLAEQIRQRRWPCFVALLPASPHGLESEELLGIQRYHPPYLVADMEEFARTLNATTFDGSAMHAGLSKREASKLWFPIDEHWNQQGSDRFAAFMFGQLKNWMAFVRQEKARSPTPN